MSYQHRDHERARGFNLMRQSPKVKAEFSVRHLLAPVKSTNPGYIGTKIREQLANTSVTAVLIGKDTANSDWVAKEIAWSLEKGNGLVGILIDPRAAIPEALRAYGAEIVDWTDRQTIATFEDAIERAALRAGRGARIAASVGAGGTCVR
jgi:hypothetical protein